MVAPVLSVSLSNLTPTGSYTLRTGPAVVACATTDATSVTIIGTDILSGLAGMAADHALSRPG
jgi:hypothetical protein